MIESNNLEDHLYAHFVLVFHIAGLSTCLDTINECCVFEVDKNGEPSYPEGFKNLYRGNFKVQGSTILLRLAESPTKSYIRIEDLADPDLHKVVLKFFGVAEWKIDHLLEGIFSKRFFGNPLK